jgi:hypothetical protein
MSASASWLKSATATSAGRVPAVRVWPSEKVAPVEPSSVVTVPLEPATTKSGSLSASKLKSPTAIDDAPPGIAMFAGAENEPATPPVRIETLAAPLFATARSSSPSALKSPTATSDGLAGRPMEVGAPKFTIGPAEAWAVKTTEATRARASTTPTRLENGSRGRTPCGPALKIVSILSPRPSVGSGWDLRKSNRRRPRGIGPGSNQWQRHTIWAIPRARAR